MPKFKAVLPYLMLFFLVIYLLDAYTFINFLYINNFPRFHFGGIGFSYLALYFIFLSFSFFIPSSKVYKIFLVLVSIPATFFYIFILGHLLYYGSPITIVEMQTILDTNTSEAGEFFQTLFGIKTFLLFILLAIPYILIWFLTPPKILNKKIKLYAGISMILIAGVIIGFTYDKRWVKREISFFNLFDTYIVTKKDRVEFMQRLEAYDSRHISFDNITSSLVTKKHTFVVIISESQNRQHFELYGYKRPTNPGLTALKDDLYIFQDVIAPHVHTNAVLEKILTFKDNEGGGCPRGGLNRIF